MFYQIKSRFFKDESGAVTVDWVVLTAGIVIMGISVLLVFRPGTGGQADQVSAHLLNAVSIAVAQ